VVEQATGRGTSLDIGGVSSPNRSNRLKAVNNYLTRTSAGAEGPNTLQVAKNIDAAITKNFVSEHHTALLTLGLIATSFCRRQQV
jgi:hypothetical protein